MSKNHLGIASLLAIFVLFGAGCWSKDQTQASDTQQVTRAPLGALGSDQPGQPVTQDKPQGPVIDSVFKNPETKTQVTIQSQKDQKGQIYLANPFVFFGTTIVFENQFAWRVKDGKGNVLAGSPAYAQSPDMGLPGAFRIRGIFDRLPDAQEGTLELYDESAKDGSEIMLISVPVRFADMQMQDVTIYFNNVQKDPDMLDCSKVYPVTHQAVVTTEIPEQAAIHELLKGPDGNEKDAGYISSLPINVNQPSIKWVNDKLVADFDSTLQYGVGGSCRVSAIRSQLEKTLGQACQKGICTISVDGRTEDILQP